MELVETARDVQRRKSKRRTQESIPIPKKSKAHHLKRENRFVSLAPAGIPIENNPRSVVKKHVKIKQRIINTIFMASKRSGHRRS